MKAQLRLMLALCLMIGLLSGLFIHAETIEIYDLNIGAIDPPSAGGAVKNTALTGIPDGYTAKAEWLRYDYTDARFESYTEDFFRDNSVYMLSVSFSSEGAVLSYEADTGQFCIGGDRIDLFTPVSLEERGYADFTVGKIYTVGNITMLDSISITALPACEAGASTDAGEVLVPEDGHFRVIDVYWRTDGTDGVYNEPVLAGGEKYVMCVHIAPVDGYWFGEGTLLSSPSEPLCQGTDTASGHFCASFGYDLREVTEEISLVSDIRPSYGAQIETDTAPSLPEDAPYGISDIRWYTYTQELERVSAEGVFGYGRYELEVVLVPSDGTVFSSACAVFVNGESILGLDTYSCIITEESAVISFFFLIEPSFDMINRIELSDAPNKIAAGYMPPDCELTADSDEYTVTDIIWTDEEGDAVDGAFANGKVYYLSVTLTPGEGYAFSEGAFSVVYSDHDNYLSSTPAVNGDGTLTVNIRYSLLEKITHVSITLPEPTVGNAPTAPESDSVCFFINYYTWVDGDQNTVSMLGQGGVYYLDIYIRAGEGYEFDEYVTLTLNGSGNLYEAVTDIYDGYIRQRFSFSEKIDRIDVSMPTPTLGGTANISDITVPEGAGYFISGQDTSWYGYNSDFTGIFGRDRYVLDLFVEACEGREFTVDAEVYINGVLCPGLYVSPDCDYVCAEYMVSFLDPIDRIELSIPYSVNAGDMLDEAVLPTPDDSKYTASYQWFVYEGSIIGEPYTGEAEAGVMYCMSIIALPAQGYEFSDGAEIIINGKKLTNVIYFTDNDQIMIVRLYPVGYTVIDRVDITLTPPVVGEMPDTTAETESTHCTVDMLSWIVSDTGNGAEDMDSDAVFENGKLYLINLHLRASEGCVFSEDLVITVNGTPVNISTQGGVPGFPSVWGDTASADHSLGVPSIPEPPEPEDDPVFPNPPTSDSSALGMYCILFFVSASLLCAVILTEKKDSRR